MAPHASECISSNVWVTCESKELNEILDDLEK
jgi:hypothetical protein